MLTDYYLEKVFRLDYQDNVEWDAWKTAYFVCVGNPIHLFQDHILALLSDGFTLDEICQQDKTLYRSKLAENVLNPPQIFI